jgi:DMSO/TMAO reductase YedYZ molybdopterin-dependent catalytic subunit
VVSGHRPLVDGARVPPGQHVVEDFPVLSAGSTPHTPLDAWTFQISGAIGERVSWRWEEWLALRAETPTVDIHCVTAWSKLDTTWTGRPAARSSRCTAQRDRVATILAIGTSPSKRPSTCSDA